MQKKKPLISLGWFSGGPLYIHDRLIMLIPTVAFSTIFGKQRRLIDLT
jgi:hypothetical protein